MSKDKEDEIQLPVFLMVRREKLTIFLEAFENTKVIEILITLQCIVKKAAVDMRLMKENQQTKLFNQKMDNAKTLTDLGFTADVCTPQSPGVAALVYRIEGTQKEYEPVAMEPYSSPPELPEVMKTPAQENEKKD